MERDRLEQILQEGEGALIEFKKSFSPSIVKEIVAFANTAGGTIFVGIDDSNKVVGTQLNNEMKSRIQDIANNCKPRIPIKIESGNYDGKEVILIKVPESRDKPVQCSEGFFYREGANSQKMQREEIFQYAQKTGRIRFESQHRSDFKYPADFDEKKFDDLMRKMGLTLTVSREGMLETLGMGEKNAHFLINNAGILFFGKKRQTYLRQAYVTCVLYKGIDRYKILDRKDFREEPVTDYENSFIFLQQHLNLEYVIKGGGPRLEIPEIPYEALREALMNAIIHRDYFEEGARVMVEIFDNRVEISNPGELLFDKEDLGRRSVARNPVIFDIFHRLGLIEKVGSGIGRILNQTRERGVEIEFDLNRFFTIIFKRPVRSKEYSLENDETKRKKKKAKTDESHTIEEQINLSDNEIKILTICAERPHSSNEILEKLGYKERPGSYKKSLKKLLDLNILVRTLPNKPRSPNQKYKTKDEIVKIIKNTYEPLTDE
ncbi:RNA-binding domain-containing protein [Methanosarcina sp. MTP4]|uniref:RNA-binding domain-containing protein n=1 Tax=Methanosarcina sp. MTP4 TaxID=1434100 RepID=UPI00064E6480|nr:RNA-binding domain-containing protein [Methanosarcina sp. MTP4]